MMMMNMLNAMAAEIVLEKKSCKTFHGVTEK